MSSIKITTNMDRPDVPMVKCMVHFIGRGAPLASSDGIEAIQKPLTEMYMRDGMLGRAVDMPRDAYLVALTSGLLLIPVNPLDKQIWLRIQELRSCAAVKGVQNYPALDGSGGKQLAFLPLDIPDAKGSQMPSIFTVIMGRANGLPLTDCYAFICQSDETALALVVAVQQAFANRKGWSTSGKPPSIKLGDLEEDSDTKSVKCDDDNDCCGNAPPEYYRKPPLNGFFYSPRPELVRKYYIGMGADAPQPEPQLELILVPQPPAPVQPPAPAPVQPPPAPAPVQPPAPVPAPAPVQPPAPAPAPAAPAPAETKPEIVYITVNQVPGGDPSPPQMMPYPGSGDPSQPQVVLPYSVYMQLMQQQQQQQQQSQDALADDSMYRDAMRDQMPPQPDPRDVYPPMEPQPYPVRQPRDMDIQDLQRWANPNDGYPNDGYPTNGYPNDGYPKEMMIRSSEPLPNMIVGDLNPPPPRRDQRSFELQLQPGNDGMPPYDPYGYTDQLPPPGGRFYPNQLPPRGRYPPNQPPPRGMYSDYPPMNPDPQGSYYPADQNPYLMPSPDPGPTFRPQLSSRPPPPDVNLPPGAVPFDSNFILARSDVDRNRMANNGPYRVPVDFGY